jgi:hypothetical protein
MLICYRVILNIHDHIHIRGVGRVRGDGGVCGGLVSDVYQFAGA